MKPITSFDELYNLPIGTNVLGRKKNSLSGDKVLMPDEGIAIVNVHAKQRTEGNLIGSIHSRVEQMERKIEISLPIHGVRTLSYVTESDFKMYDRDLFILDEAEYSEWLNKYT